MHNDASKYQLPKSVVPGHYDILVRPDFGSFRFSGRVVVDVEVREPVSRITVQLPRAEDHRGPRGRRPGKRPSTPSRRRPRVSFCRPRDGRGRAKSNSRAPPPWMKRPRPPLFRFDGSSRKAAWKLVAEYEGSLVQPSLEGFYSSKWTDDEQDGPLGGHDAIRGNPRAPRLSLLG